MFPRLLLPHKYKTVGWIILVPATIFGFVLLAFDFNSFQIHASAFAIVSDEFLGESHSFSFIKTNIAPTLAGVLFIIGALLVSFSKEEREDEFISNLRLSSLLWAVLVNYLLLLIAFLFIYGTPFLSVMIYNMFTVLILFIIRFHFVLYRTSKSLPDEKLN